MPSEFIDILRTYGLAGVVMFALGYACIKLYNRNQELHDTLNEVGREAVKANEQSANALAQMAEVNRSLITSVQNNTNSMNQLLWRHGIKAGE